MSDERRARRGRRNAPHRVVRLACRQGGAISVEQAEQAGLSSDQVQRRVDEGWLERETRGVLRLGVLTPDGRLWAATLAMGGDVAVSLLAAGHEHGVLTGRRPSKIDVTLPAQRRPRRDIRPHRGRLAPADVVRRRGLRFTSLARTLLDLAGMLSAAQLDAAVDEARYRRKLNVRAIEATIARNPGHRGIAALRRSVARHEPGRGMPRSELERRAARFLRDRGFPKHERNAEVHLGDDVFLVDVLFPGRKVVLELDSRLVHDNDPAFASDRRRIRRFAAHGWHLVPVTAEDLESRPDELAADVWSTLGTGPG